VHLELVAVFGRATHFVEVAEVDLRINSLRKHVEPERDKVDIARALPVSEQAALDAVRAGHVTQLGGSNAGAAVVVRVERQQNVFAVH
jgi:hypothetical protein